MASPEDTCVLQEKVRDQEKKFLGDRMTPYSSCMTPMVSWAAKEAPRKVTGTDFTVLLDAPGAWPRKSRLRLSKTECCHQGAVQTKYQGFPGG